MISGVGERGRIAGSGRRRWCDKSGLHVHARRLSRRADGELHHRWHGDLQHRLHADWRGYIRTAQRHGELCRGSLTATVTVDPTADSTVEPDETVILTVVAGAGYSVGAPSSATGTITNDDTDVSVAVAPIPVAEDGAANLVYTFTRTGVTTGALTVNFTIGGIATFSADYTQTGAATFVPPNGTVTFGAGNSTATVTVDPTADTTFETDETVILTVAAGTGYGIGAPNSATGTITNDDTPFPGVRLVITSALRCDGGNVINAVTISNRGDTTAFSVQLTQAQLQSPLSMEHRYLKAMATLVQDNQSRMTSALVPIQPANKCLN